MGAVCCVRRVATTAVSCSFVTSCHPPPSPFPTNRYVGAWPLGLCYLMPQWWFGQVFFGGSMLVFGRVFDVYQAQSVFRYQTRGDMLLVSFGYMLVIGLAYRAIAYALMMYTRQER